MSKPKWQILRDLSPMVRQYLETALWSTGTSDEQGHCTGNLDDNYGVEDLTKTALIRAINDCRDFCRYCRETGIDLEPFDNEQIGHDFWLTRNGHGAGFWDGDYPKEIGEQLTKASKTFGSCDADAWRGKVHFI